MIMIVFVLSMMIAMKDWSDSVTKVNFVSSTRIQMPERKAGEELESECLLWEFGPANFDSVVGRTPLK